MGEKSTTELFRELVNAADVLAAAIVKQMRPAEDRISTRQAYDIFGSGYIRKRTHPKGPLVRMRAGKAKNSPMTYSRADILALAEAERQQQLAMKSLVITR